MNLSFDNPLIFLQTFSFLFFFKKELMPVLHNYVMIDTNAFLFEPQRLEVVFKMIKQVNIFLFIKFT